MTDSLTIAWFAPSAGNWVTHRMEHRLANALASAGHDVTMIQCDAVLAAYCPVMVPAGLAATSPDSSKRAVCKECQYSAGITRNAARYATTQLSQFLSDADREQVGRIIQALTPDSWEGVEIDGIPVGRYAAYTTMLHHKRPTVSDTDETWAEYRADLEDALLVALATPRIQAALNPTNAVVYNALYPANRAFAEAMLARQTPVLNLAGGPSVPRRYSTLSLFDGIRASQTTTDSAAFRSAASIPCSMQEVMHVERHIGQLISGTDPWVYSAAPTGKSAATVRTALGVRPDTSVATVLVNSPDETRSAQLVDAEYFRADDYSDVAEYLQACVELARSRPEVDFVIRLHPRLAPNKREKVTSPDLEHLYDALSDIPSNAVINHPSEGISLYELVAVSDVAINQSSSAGLEFLAFGVPIVQYDPPRLGAYPPSFTLQVGRHDPQGFVDALDTALTDGFALERALNAYRWYATLHIRSVVHLDLLDPYSVPPSEDSVPQEVPAVAQPRAITRLIPTAVRAGIDRRIIRRQREQDAIDEPIDAVTLQRVEQSLRDSRVSGDIWEPVMLIPESSTSGEERHAVREALIRLRTRLPIDAGSGVVGSDPATWT